MQPLTHDQIRGNWAPVILPINADDSIDYARLADTIDTLIAFKVDGIYSNGTTAEFYNQTEAEFDAIHQLFAEKCQAADMPFQIGVSHMSPVVSLERLRRVCDLAPGAVQVILPDWFPVTEPEAIAYLQRMAAAADPVGLVLYNPGHAKRTLTLDEIGRLKATVPALIGVKVIGGDATWFAEARRHMPDVSIFVAGHTLASGWEHGAHGAYSNVACLHPGAAQRWTDQMRHDLPAAQEVEARIQVFMRDYIHPYIAAQRYANQAVDKLLTVIGKWASIGSRLRWPYRWIPETEADRLRPIARDLLPEFFTHD